MTSRQWEAERSRMMGIRHIGVAAVAGAFACLFLATPADSQQGESGRTAADPVVYCFDKARGIAMRAMAADCRGEVISEEEAEAIRVRRVQAIQRAIRNSEQPVYADKRMVSIGTGFFVSDGGRLITNRHVVDRCDALSVETTSGTIASATLLQFDDKLDIALLQANLAPQATAVFQARDTVPPGGSVAVIGYPDQGLPPRKPLMSIGSTVPLDPTRHGERLAIRAEVRPGNSGGPVLDQWGNVVGIINAKIDTVKVYSKTKRLIRNVGFAIGTPAILRFLDETGTSYRRNAVGSLLSADQIFERARPFVVRVGCWR